MFYYLKQPLYFGGKYPISYFATLPETRWVFSLCYVLAAISFWIFTKHHLNRHYVVPTKTFGISLMLFAGTGLVPVDFNNTLSLAVHSALALSSGLLFLAGMYLMAKKSDDPKLFKGTITAIILSFGLTLAFLASPKGSHLIFSFEVGSWLMLQLWTIWVTLHIRSSERQSLH